MSVAVCIPCYKVKNQIVETVKSVPSFVQEIIVVDDCCPENSGKYLEENSNDPRLTVIYHKENTGVGGAMVTAYKTFLKTGKSDIAVKIDGDGQMNPDLIIDFVSPISDKKYNYTKGNRFYFIEGLKDMPGLRLFGNSMLSLINKLVNGYWDLMDPTNGFTAIHKDVLKLIPLNKLDNRYFFESDMLFRLGLVNAAVKDIPMHALYADEVSNLSVRKTLITFPPKYIKRFFKRIFYQYFLRDFNAGTIQLTIGLPLFLFGVVFGIVRWYESIELDTEASAGTIMLSALPIIIGFQMLLGFLNYDIQKTPESFK